MIGNLMAISYFLLFQVIGICMASAVMKEENKIVQMLLGSTFGSLLLQWLPILFAFFSDFSLISHILALVCALGIGGILIVKSNGSKLKNKIGEQ